MFQNENNEDPDCYMAYNADFIEAQCHFVAELSSSIDDLESQLLGECIDLSWQMSQTAKGRSVVDTSQALPAVQSTSNSSHTARDADGEESRDTVAVGDGNPHQNGWNYQCNDALQCDQSNSCASGVTTSDAFNWNFMAAATPFRWISAGFNVGQSFTTTQTQTCNAMPGQSVSVWHLEIYTAYTVQNQIFSCAITGCKTTNSGDPFVLSSPNTIQNNSHYYCVINTCRNKKDGYFENGPPGPPPT
ncbi:hypothetical protein PRZ48_009006 [Zasmidium cellare]|uniref:Uncharacterized protein n=1 Tax=Zasmidium cellare TaxID=395010 RepID=A0ABR0EH57_ZASCE|nr:hypothetical protein PRZ48_009006 [Zasmidium cellare]